MASFGTARHQNLSSPRRLFMSSIGLLMLFGAVSSSAIPPLELATDYVDLQSSYSFNCYSPGQACRGSGATHGGGSSTEGCTPISAKGCSQYSYNGGGQYKVCIYDNRECSGNTITSVNGGTVSCLGIENAGGYKVITRDHAC